MVFTHVFQVNMAENFHSQPTKWNPLSQQVHPHCRWQITCLHKHFFSHGSMPQLCETFGAPGECSSGVFACWPSYNALLAWSSAPFARQPRKLLNQGDIPKTSMDGRHPQENTACLAMLNQFLFQSHVFCPTFQTSLFQTQVFPILAITMWGPRSIL